MRSLRLAVRLGLAGFTFALAVAVAPGANALSVYDYTFELEVGGTTVQSGLDGLPYVQTYDPTTHTYGYVMTAPVTGSDGSWTINSWSSGYDVDPFVTNNISLTNNSAVAQTFVLTVALPIPAFAYDKAIFSSVGVTATDSNANGSLSVSSLALFEGQVNGVGALSFLDPVSLTTANCTPPFPGCSATASDGIVLQALPAGVATLIGIKLQFTLSPGDSIGITSRFEIVPEPATALLFGAGLLGLAAFRRRPV